MVLAMIDMNQLVLMDMGWVMLDRMYPPILMDMGWVMLDHMNPPILMGMGSVMLNHMNQLVLMDLGLRKELKDIAIVGMEWKGKAKHLDCREMECLRCILGLLALMDPLSSYYHHQTLQSRSKLL
jgi:hypothetical protein